MVQIYLTTRVSALAVGEGQAQSLSVEAQRQPLLQPESEHPSQSSAIQSGPWLESCCFWPCSGHRATCKRNLQVRCRKRQTTRFLSRNRYSVHRLYDNGKSHANEQITRAKNHVNESMTIEQLLEAEQRAAEWMRKTKKIPSSSIEDPPERRPARDKDASTA